jgi:hypothetical protein
VGVIRTNDQMGCKSGIAGQMNTVQILEPHPVRDGLQQVAQQGFTMLQRQRRCALLCDVFYGALDIQRAPLRIAHQVGVFTHPNAFTGLEAVGFGHEIGHLPQRFQQIDKLLSASGFHVGVGTNHPSVRKTLGFAGVTVEPQQRGVDAHNFSIRVGPVGANRQQIK